MNRLIRSVLWLPILSVPCLTGIGKTGGHEEAGGGIRVELDSLVQAVVAEIRQDSIRRFMQGLEDFGTRYCLASNRDSVARWIRDEFTAMGYNSVEIDSFFFQSTWQRNVVATLPGSRNSNKVVIIGGHYDSYTGADPMHIAPGADDNASGTAAVLEVARAMKRKGLNPDATVKFIAFAAEERGTGGSQDYAGKARSSGMEVELMVNNDMIAYTGKPLSASAISVGTLGPFGYLSDHAAEMTQRYAAITAQPKVTTGADDWSFYVVGFPTIGFAETDDYPYEHTANDRVANCRLDYCTEAVKISAAVLVSISSRPAVVRNVGVTDPGTGSSLLLAWSRNTDRSLKGYKVYVGKAHATYDSAYFTTDTTCRLEHLVEGVQYFLGLVAVDVDNDESLTIERTGTAFSKPRAPGNLSAEPLWRAVALRWNRNQESDLLGYNVYRSIVGGDTLVNLNSAVLKDTQYTDATIPAGAYALYTVTAVDSSLNEAEKSHSVRSRAVTLDQGILIADETKGGDGSLTRPTDAQVNDFYHSLLSGFRTQDLDVEAQGVATLADLGAFSTVIWHGNEAVSFAAAVNSREHVKRYLEYGGKLLLSTYRPMTAFGNYSGASRDFAAGDFMYDVLKIARSEVRAFSRFSGALPAAPGFPALYVDSSKTLASMNFHLENIEGMKPAPGASEILVYDTFYDTTQLQGKMKGQPVGIEYIGGDTKIVVLSFPLYFMKADAAQNLVRYLLASRFHEPAAVLDPLHEVPSRYGLLQNYPNPFNVTTIIRFELERSEFVTLEVFNVLGEMVRSLLRAQQAAGQYSVVFDAKSLPSGVYVYRLHAGSTSECRKMVLIR